MKIKKLKLNKFMFKKAHAQGCKRIKKVVDFL